MATTPPRLRQAQPDEREPPSTDGSLFDDGAIWIGARMYDTEGAAGSSRLVRRDGKADADGHFIFGAFRGHLGRAYIAINPPG
jgi:hypothetical protein